MKFINTNQVLEFLLSKRGVTQEDQIAEFLSLKPTKTYDPFLLHNLAEGVDLLLKTIEKKGKICIYGDYDTDGVTSVCILHSIISQISDRQVDYYIPDRFDEGYGLNMAAIEEIKSRGTDLIITVDCGSMSYDEVERAKELSMDIIVTDHHNIYGRQADCILINPKQEKCTYPFKPLAGCGVAFKFAQGIVEKTGLQKSILLQTLDLVAIGTVGDVVPLIDENRTMVKYGLSYVNRRGRLGLKTLISKALPNKEILQSEDLAFQIVPHINAAGRMAKGELGVKLLLSKTIEEAEQYADQMVQHNKDRKAIQNQSYKDCLELVSEEYNHTLFPIIQVEGIHEGISGIIAGKLKDALGIPVAIVTRTEEGLKGSGRSTKEIDIFQILEENKDLFLRFGGHKAACGFLIEESNLDALRKSVDNRVKEIMSENPEETHRGIDVDGTLSPELLTVDLVHTLSQLEPFGSGNPRPVFNIECDKITDIFAMGSDQEHGRFKARFGDKLSLNCVIFSRMEELGPLLMDDQPPSLMGKLTINNWQNNESLQFLVDQVVSKDMDNEH